MIRSRRSSRATVTRKNVRLTVNASSSFLPFLGLAACGSGESAAPKIVAPAIQPATAPTVTQGQTGAVSGNVLPTANQSGAAAATITAITVEGGSAGTVGQALSTTLGTFTLNSNGSYSFTVADNAAVKALAVGVTQDVVINYTAQNSAGSATSTIKFTVTGMNDMPVASNDSVTAPTDINVAATGNVLSNDSDVDRGTTLSVTGITVQASQAGAAQNGQAALTAVGKYGTISIESNGQYSYTINKADIDFLALRDGQAATETFEYTISDGQGGTTKAALTISLAGINEGPQVAVITKTLDLRTGATSASINLGDGAVDYENDSNLVITGIGGKPLERIYDDPFAGAAAGYPSFYSVGKTVQTDIGTFSIYGPDSVAKTIALNWSFLNFGLDGSNAKVLALKDGEILNQTFTYEMADGRGGVSQNSITLNIIGRDDAPTFKVTPTAYEVSAATPSFTVKLSDLIADPEGGTSTITSIGYYSNFAGQTFATSSGTVLVNADSTVTFTLDTNSYGYRAASATTALQDSFNFIASDGAQQNYLNILIKVTGVNDAPTANPATMQINFDQASSTINLLNYASDSDSGDSITLANVASQPLPSATTLTSASGLFTAAFDSFNNLIVAVNRSNSTAANLAYGAQLTDTFSYAVKDSVGATASSTLTVTLTGTKQTPTTGNDVIYLTQLTDSFDGLGGNDRFVMTDQRTSYYYNSGFIGVGDSIIGGSGSDTLDFRNGGYSYFNQAIFVDLTKSTPIKVIGYSGEEQQDTTVSGVENIYATQQNDRLYGSTDANILYGGDGNDDISGLGGNDVLIGGGGADIGSGGAGDDLIIAENADGGGGSDLLLASASYQSSSSVLRGGAGADTFIVSADNYFSNFGTVRIADFANADGDKIDLSALRDASGNALDLQDILDNSSVVGDSVQIALNTFKTAFGNSVSGALVIDGVSSAASLVAGDFVFTGGVDWKALIPIDINGGY
jgi:VCBS repeat-containing protein